MDRIITITPDTLPQGLFWDDDGACYQATRAPTLPDGWYWQACNEKALTKGYAGQALHDFYLPPHKPNAEA